MKINKFLSIFLGLLAITTLSFAPPSYSFINSKLNKKKNDEKDKKDSAYKKTGKGFVGTTFEGMVHPHLAKGHLSNKYGLEIGYNINSYLFLKEKFKFGPDTALTNINTVGLRYQTGKLEEYAEISYDWRKSDFDYAVGLNWKMTSIIFPFIELDDLLANNDEAWKIGAHLNVGKKMYFKASYKLGLHGTADSYKIGMFYVL